MEKLWAIGKVAIFCFTLNRLATTLLTVFYLPTESSDTLSAFILAKPWGHLKPLPSQHCTCSMGKALCPFCLPAPDCIQSCHHALLREARIACQHHISPSKGKPQLGWVEGHLSPPSNLSEFVNIF